MPSSDYIFAGLSTQGNTHERNEDSYFIGDGYAVVADGMGGEAAGDVASRIVVDTIKEDLADASLGELNVDDLRHRLCDAIARADQRIIDYVDEHPEADGMGSTVAIAVFAGGEARVAWVGDSRVYAYGRKDGLQSITRDHSYVQELVDAGELDADQAIYHPDSNLITRYVGGGLAVCKPSFNRAKLHDDTVVVLCSDGLCGYCLDSAIRKALDAVRSLDDAPKALTDAALAADSGDDITVIAASASRDLPRKKSFLGLF